MIYPVHWNGVRYCRIRYTLGDVGVLSAGTPVSGTPTTPSPNDCETRTDSERKSFAQIQAERHRQAKETAEQWERWSRSVTERLANEHSKFLEEFDENQRRIFGVGK